MHHPGHFHFTDRHQCIGHKKRVPGNDYHPAYRRTAGDDKQNDGE